MSYRYAPAFRIRSYRTISGSVPPLATFSLVQTSGWTRSDGALVVGNHEYAVFYSLDGAGRLMESGGLSGAVAVPSTSTYAARIAFDALGGDAPRTHWVWKKAPGWSDYRLVGWVPHGTDEWYDLTNNTEAHAIEEIRPGQPGTRYTSGRNDSVEIDLSKYEFDPVTETVVPRSTQFEHLAVTRIAYEDIGQDPERENLNDRINRRESGVRPRAELSFRIRPGTDFEWDLISIYAARLAYPHVRLEFTLNYSSEQPVWREVQVSGNFPRSPVGPNQFIETSWDILSLEPIESVPFPVVTDGRGFW